MTDTPDTTNETRPEALTLPVLPLREMVLFPGVTAPIRAGRPETLRAIQASTDGDDRLVFAVAQRENREKVVPDRLYTIGTIAKIGQLQHARGVVQLLLEGQRRGIALRISENDGHFEAIVRPAEEMRPVDSNDPVFQGLRRELRDRATELGSKSGFPEEIVSQTLASAIDGGLLADLVASYLEIGHEERQALLETLSIEERLRRVLVHVQRQIGVLDAQEEIKSRVQQELGDRQREMVLREQLKAIRSELGEGDETEELDELRESLDALELHEAARKEVDRELGRLGRMNRESMEYQVIRTYLETVAELPWTERSDGSFDLARAQEILDEDHYGLEDVKDRVLEFLAVRQLQQAKSDAAEKRAEADEDPESADTVAAGESSEAAPAEDVAAEDLPAENLPADDPVVDAAADPAGDSVPVSETSEEAPEAEDRTDERPKIPGNWDDRTARGPILLFAGPPGVGKTSIAQSIARSMGREYVRISLGGARDEADIRGHRRTYVGAMPGRILRGMKEAGTKNPVFLLDEVDKLGVSYQGDPASALLEVLDPAQNDSFVDHYLGVSFDLSEVLFIATANFLEAIPGPLRDRMETVEFTGYTEREKLEIATRYLVPRQLHSNALELDQIELTEAALEEVISRYTREAGVRQLEREIGRLARKVARKIASGEVERYTLGADEVRELLGRSRIRPEKAAVNDQVGVATGMFYTPVGGDILFVEVTTMRGKGELVLTGQLGDVMKESARAAWSYARSHAAELGIDDGEFDRDVHVHVPAGAVPKDGPSAGVTIATALVSALSGRPARHDLAMTGEITLSGRVLPIGGVKEKVLGAVRAGIERIVLPEENEADLEDLPAEVQERLEIHPVRRLSQVLDLAIRDSDGSRPRRPVPEPTAGELLDDGVEH